jgi:hypothetical protein
MKRVGSLRFCASTRLGQGLRSDVVKLECQYEGPDVWEGKRLRMPRTKTASWKARRFYPTFLPTDLARAEDILIGLLHMQAAVRHPPGAVEQQTGRDAARRTRRTPTSPAASSFRPAESSLRLANNAVAPAAITSYTVYLAASDPALRLLE